MATTKAYEIGQLGSKLTVDSDGDLAINSINGLLVDTNTLTVDPTNNRVGIGTASPNRKLTIAGGNDAKIAFTGGGTQSLYFGDGAGAAEYAGYIHYTHSDDQMRFNTTTDFAFTGGNVGIGTTSPDTSAKLHTYTTNATARTITETSQSGGYSGYRLTNGTGYWEMQVDGSNQSLRFLDDGTERFDISSTSQVTVYGHIKPDTTLAYDLGDSDNRFRDIYLSGQTINLAGTKLSVDSSGDLELKDLSNNFKKIRAKELEFDDAADSDHKTILKRDNSGRMSFVKVRRSDGVELTDSADKVRLDFDNMTTADLTEHTKNRYFTDARARGSVSISNVSGHGSLGYNSSTGVISYTGISTSTVRGLISVSGDLSYNSSTGVISTQGLASSTTDNLSEGSTNLYYTNARADARIAAASTADLSEDSSNLYFTNARADARIAAATTDDLSEGNNLYYTQARFNSAFTAKSTTNLSEGSNLYYTTARSDSDTSVYIAGNRTFGNITTTGYIAGPSTLTIDPAGVGDNTGTVVIAGDLQVDGTTTTINSTALTVDDLNITLASGAANAAAANGAGITVDGASATIEYNSTHDEWHLSKGIKAVDYSVGDGTKVIDSGKRGYFVNLQNSSPISFLTGTNGVSGSGAQGINVRHVYAGTTYASSTAGAGDIEASANFKMAGNVVIDSSRNITSGNINVGGVTSGTPLTSGSQYKVKMGQQYWNSTKGTDSSIKLELYSTGTSDTYGLGVSNSELEIQSQSDIGFYAGGNSTRTKRMHIEGSNGNVGIGTSSPAHKLDVAGTSRFTNTLNIERSDGTFLQLKGNSNNTGYINWESNGFTFYTNGPVEALRIGSSGIVVNEDSRDYDFRVESNDSTSMLFVDGGNNKVLVAANNTASVTNSATALAARTFEVNGNQSEGTDNLSIFAMADGTGNYGIEVSNSLHTAQYDLLLNPINGGNVGIGTTSPAEMLDVAGNIKHTGLTMTSGTDVDQLYTVTKSITLSTSWQTTGIDGSDLSTGSYMVQLYVNDQSVGGGQYEVYYTGVMSWFSVNTNDNETDEIVLHRAGHAPNAAAVYLKTVHTYTADTDDLELHIRGTQANTGASDYQFKFRRLI